MLKDYDTVMQHVFADEGGYGWDRGDPGGPTKYGITCYDLAEHRGQNMTSMDKWAPIVKEMSKSEAEDIYKTKYAKGCRFDDLNPGKDYVILDYGINSGISRPIRVAQTLLGLPVTGKFDSNTLKAINDAEPQTFINNMQNERLSFMKAIKGGASWKLFGVGWGRRVGSVRHISLQLALNETASLPEPSDGSVPSNKATNQVDAVSILIKAILGTIGSLSAIIPALNVYTPHGVNSEFFIGACFIAGIAGLISYIWHEQSVQNANNKVVLPQGSSK